MSEDFVNGIGRITLETPVPGDIVNLEASGGDQWQALESALQATLAVAGFASTEAMPGDEVRSAPIRGEGDDLPALIADTIEDLLGQIEFFGSGLRDVTLDGFLRRDHGGYIAWGYASGAPRPASGWGALHLHGKPTVNEDDPEHVVIQASFIRDGNA